LLAHHVEDGRNLSVRVLLVDDHRLLRESLSGMLARLPDVEVVGEADNGREALLLVATHRPDMVIMDVSMPGMNGVQATQRITQDYPDTKVIGLSMHAEPHLVLGMLKAGAAGYLLKNSAFEELVQALEAVANRGTYLPPEIANIVVKGMQSPAPDGEEDVVWSYLTLREREVLQLLAEGRSSESIAETLHVSIHTVYAHRRNIMQKTNASNLAELTRIAIRERLTSITG
jgi:two-component system, NarL family, response regulator NreC